MADPVVDPTPAPAPAPAPAFDPNVVKEAVRTSMEGFVKEAQARQAEAAAAKAAEEAERARPTGLDEMFKPHLEPALKAARDAEARALLAADSAEFYTNPKMAEAAEFRDKIEELVAAQAKRGNLISRKDAWSYLRGGDLYDTLQERRSKAHAEKVEEARKATAAGPGVTAPKFAKPLEDLTTDELGAALRDVRF